MTYYEQCVLWTRHIYFISGEVYVEWSRFSVHLRDEKCFWFKDITTLSYGKDVDDDDKH
jgi:hypothetical protein